MSSVAPSTIATELAAALEGAARCAAALGRLQARSEYIAEVIVRAGRHIELAKLGVATGTIKPAALETIDEMAPVLEQIADIVEPLVGTARRIDAAVPKAD